MFWPSTWILSIWKGHYAYFFHKLYIRINICVRVLHETTRYLTYLSMYLFIYLSIYLINLSIYLSHFILLYLTLPYLTFPYLTFCLRPPCLILSYLPIFLSCSIYRLVYLHVRAYIWSEHVGPYVRGKLQKNGFHVLPQHLPRTKTYESIKII